MHLKMLFKNTLPGKTDEMSVWWVMDLIRSPNCMLGRDLPLMFNNSHFSFHISHSPILVKLGDDSNTVEAGDGGTTEEP